MTNITPAGQKPQGWIQQHGWNFVGKCGFAAWVMLLLYGFVFQNMVDGIPFLPEIFGLVLLVLIAFTLIGGAACSLATLMTPNTSE